MRIKYARKFSFFILWLLYVGLQLVSRKNRYGLVWAMMINPQLPINNEVWNEANIASTGVRLYYHKRRNGKLVMHKPVTRGCAGKRSLPCKIFRPKNVLGHSWKNLGPSHRTLRHPGVPNWLRVWWCIINQLNQARWNWTVLKFDSENQLNVHNYL